jgi:TetR/AcrR family transcriptional regulator
MRHRDAALTTKKLLSVAENLFDEKGYYPVTLKEIGVKAGCSSALVAYYFGSKQALYQAVINQQLDQIHFLWNETESTDLSPLQKFSFFLKHLLKIQLDPAGHLNLAYKEIVSPSGLLDDTLWKRILSMGNYLKALLVEAGEAGELKPFEDPRKLSYLAFTLESITETLFLVKDRSFPLNPDKRPLEEILEELIDFALEPMKTGKNAKTQGRGDKQP